VIQPALTRCGCAAAKEDGGWRTENGMSPLRADSSVRTEDLDRHAQFFGVTTHRATAGLETGIRGGSVAGNRRRMGIRGVDASGEANRGTGAGGGLGLGEWRTVLWYQSRSRVVPDWYQAAKGEQTTFLSIANAYAAQPQTSSKPFQNVPTAPRVVARTGAGRTSASRRRAVGTPRPTTERGANEPRLRGAARVLLRRSCDL
jgi:hypothetical protein